MGELIPWPIRKVPEGVELTVWVQPGAQRTGIVGHHGDAVKIRVAAQAKEGLANKALVELLAESLGISKTQIQIVRGEKSRKKTVLIRGLNGEDLKRKLA